MRPVLIAALLTAASWGQTFPDLSNQAAQAGKIASSSQDAYNREIAARQKAAQMAAQTKLLKEQTALLKEQADALKQQQVAPVLSASGNDFLDKCPDPDNPSVPCIAYVAGVTDGLEVLQNPGFCPPQGMTYGQSFRITVKFAKDHPESLQKRTAVLIHDAHVAAFPCSDSH